MHGWRLRAWSPTTASNGDDLPCWTEVTRIDDRAVPRLVVPWTPDTDDMRFVMPQGFSHGETFIAYLRDAVARHWLTQHPDQSNR